MTIPLLYKDRRLSGDTPLRQMQLTGLHILSVFDAICRQHNLRYWLMWGTLLGAVRHKGFIPWDDDIDVLMPDEDLWKFVTVAEKILPQDVVLQSVKTFPRMLFYHCKLRDAYSSLLTAWAPEELRQCDPCGMPMDIFSTVKIHGKWGIPFLQAVKGPLFWRSQQAREIGPVTLVRLLRKWVLRTFLVFVDLLWNIRKLFPFGKEYYIIKNAFLSDKTVILDASWLDKTTVMSFENEMFTCPANYHEVLRVLYGETYMTPLKTHTHGSVYLPTTHGSAESAMDYDEVRRQIENGDDGK